MPEDLEARLRRELRSWADEAPPPHAVSVRTLDAADATPAERARPAWLLSAIAACVVFLVVGGTVGGIALVRHLTKPSQPTAPTQTASPATPTGSVPSVHPTSPNRTTNPPSSPQPAPPGAAVPVGGPVPAGFTVHDLTFVSDNEGWALGTARCSSRPCTSLVRTSDGGRSWVGIRPPVVGLIGVDDCTAACVSNVRFATPLIGYLFGPQVLYLTTDGGRTWQLQRGGAAAIEISAGNVLRVEGCFPGCPLTVQVSTIGGTGWRTILALSSAQVGTDTGVQLSRTGGHAYLQVYGHVTGGASQAHSALYVSADSGLNWADRGEPCPQVSSGEVDASALSSAFDQSVSVLCTQRSGSASFVAVSTDGGRTFQSGKLLHNLEMQVGSASSSTVFAIGTVGGRESLVRSVDRGLSWTVVAQSGSLPGSPEPRSGFLGFESATTGRWVSLSDPSTVWTTRDGGATWVPYRFH
jgi:photosystem II stability/assembly factor-like uncharacterized protein